MNKAKAFFLIILAALNLSVSAPHHIGILTQDYGIVTQADLEEGLSRCSLAEPFPPKNGCCFQYWQCLSTQQFFMACEDIGDVGDSQHTGQIHFWMKDGKSVHHYLTRRNFDIEVCHSWMDEWKAVMDGEDIVCLSGEFIKIDDQDEHPSSPEGKHYYWIIDRMKTRHSEWSYFYRGNITSERPQDLEEKQLDNNNNSEVAQDFPEEQLDNSIDAPDKFGLLGQEDLLLEENDRCDGPALSSSQWAIHPWESYNKWLCFDGNATELTRVEITYNGKYKSMPEIHAWTSTHYFEISLSADLEDANNFIYSQWEDLLAGSNPICVYAAQLQLLPSLGDRKASLWVIAGLKAKRESWFQEPNS